MNSSYEVIKEQYNLKQDRGFQQGATIPKGVDNMNSPVSLGIYCFYLF